MNIALEIPKDKITEFCRRWQVAELSLFGSVLREDFGSESDVDVLVSFQPGAVYGIDEHLAMLAELRKIFDREIDMLTRRSVEQSPNPWKRHEILGSARVVYAA